MSDQVRILVGGALERLRELPDESVHCVVTSPPYWGLRDYGVEGQLGLEPTPDEYVGRLIEVFREVRRVLRSDGTCWLNLGDTYLAGMSGGIGPHSEITSQRNHEAVRQAQAAKGGARHRSAPGLKPKDLVGIPWRVALALQADGWWLRSDVIWHKPSPMPESVRDRPTRAHEYLFLLTKSSDYYFDQQAIAEPALTGARGSSFIKGKTGAAGLGRASRKARNEARTRNKRSVWRLDDVEAQDVWTIPQEPYPHSHFATFPKRLVQPCVLAGCPVDGVVLDLFGGSGTTGEVALELGRRSILIELNPEYLPLIEKRLQGVQYPLALETRAKEVALG